MTQPTLAALKDLVISESGCAAVGVTAVAEVEDSAVLQYRQWIAEGRHGAMSYLERYDDVRRNPARLLEGARTLVMTAFSFANPDAIRRMEAAGQPLISEYALGYDYHTELRKRLRRVAVRLMAEYGGKARVCVDTAPLRERYWAQRAGLGFVGVNNYLIIPGRGAHFCLGALLWTGEPSDGYDAPCRDDCGHCGACVSACPTGALSADGSIDARRCLSYLTIESRDPIPDDVATGRRVFGCDTCRKVCPHTPSSVPLTDIDAFVARDEITRLTADDWLAMTPEQFDRLFGDSALSRAGLERIRAAVLRILSNRL